MSVKNAIQMISSETIERIEVLVNNAGYRLNGAVSYRTSI
jgi:short-subunit dehydrogenase